MKFFDKVINFLKHNKLFMFLFSFFTLIIIFLSLFFGFNKGENSRTNKEIDLSNNSFSELLNKIVSFYRKEKLNNIVKKAFKISDVEKTKKLLNLNSIPLFKSKIIIFNKETGEINWNIIRTLKDPNIEEKIDRWVRELKKLEKKIDIELSYERIKKSFFLNEIKKIKILQIINDKTLNNEEKLEKLGIDKKTNPLRIINFDDVEGDILNLKNITNLKELKEIEKWIDNILDKKHTFYFKQKIIKKINTFKVKKTILFIQRILLEKETSTLNFKKINNLEILEHSKQEIIYFFKNFVDKYGVFETEKFIKKVNNLFDIERIYKTIKYLDILSIIFFKREKKTVFGINFEKLIKILFIKKYGFFLIEKEIKEIIKLNEIEWNWLNNIYISFDETKKIDDFLKYLNKDFLKLEIFFSIKEKISENISNIIIELEKKANEISIKNRNKLSSILLTKIDFEKIENKIYFEKIEQQKIYLTNITETTFDIFIDFNDKKKDKLIGTGFFDIGTEKIIWFINSKINDFKSIFEKINKFLENKKIIIILDENTKKLFDFLNNDKFEIESNQKIKSKQEISFNDSENYHFYVKNITETTFDIFIDFNNKEKKDKLIGTGLFDIGTKKINFYLSIKNQQFIHFYLSLKEYLEEINIIIVDENTKKLFDFLNNDKFEIESNQKIKSKQEISFNDSENYHFYVKNITETTFDIFIDFNNKEKKDKLIGTGLFDIGTKKINFYLSIENQQFAHFYLSLKKYLKEINIIEVDENTKKLFIFLNNDKFEIESNQKIKSKQKIDYDNQGSWFTFSYHGPYEFYFKNITNLTFEIWVDYDKYDERIGMGIYNIKKKQIKFNLNSRFCYEGNKKYFDYFYKNIEIYLIQEKQTYLNYEFNILNSENLKIFSEFEKNKNNKNNKNTDIFNIIKEIIQLKISDIEKQKILGFKKLEISNFNEKTGDILYLYSLNLEQLEEWKQFISEKLTKIKNNIKQNIETQIIVLLTNEIQQIFINFKKNNLLINVLPSNWNNEKKNLFKEFIFIDNTKVEFKIGEKTISKLQSILEFITYININKETIKTKINF